MTQLEIAGAERPELPDLVAKSERYRSRVAERLAIQKQEAEDKAALIEEINNRIKDGTLSIPKDADGVIPVHYYTDEEGVERVIRHGVQEKVSVVKAYSDGE